MTTAINILKSLQTSIESESKINKILCILEGKLELNLIFNLYKILGYDKCCDELSKEKINVGWGKEITIVSNCNFQGGNQPKLKTPKPAIEAFNLYKSKINKYQAVVVVFDGDLDDDSDVENFFKSELPSLSIDNLLIVSKPCFEKTLIDFCKCGNCLSKVISLPDIKNSKCRKYKENFPTLNCFKKFTNGKVQDMEVDSDLLVENLDSSNISSLSSGSPLFKLNSIIKKNI
ncbi:hypothetical protein N5U00_01270 [Aliarcobacter butzleri]|uniref:hypothetical protein n=1 Tax=Aliarcobacter butzleri TaxID=28197 RepID=UPI00125EA790|nr:hypothetical protein [Aliarcobacter butzleri]MCT7573944.1 hypothetical protein [Aliarcobacter butzleri]MCT7593242.1 hypothetical protein [Aliarcobacter butzleri]MDK2064610.1 hypothetical protein [Aliarcobacter butzleri]